MKNYKTNIMKNLNMAAALMCAAIFTACSSDDDMLTEQSVAQTGQEVYTMTIQATKGSDAQTRGLVLDQEGTLKSLWNDGEKVIVCKSSGLSWEPIGELTAGVQGAGESGDGSTTTLTGTLTEKPTSDMRLFLHQTATDYTGQKGILHYTDDATYGPTHSIENKYDSAIGDLLLSNCTVNEREFTVTSTEPIVFSRRQAIVKFTFLDADGNPLNVTKLNIHDAVGNMRQINGVADGLTPSAHTFGDIDVTPVSPKSELFVALCNVAPSSRLTLTAETEKGFVIYTNKRDNQWFEHGKYYQVTVKMSDAVDLGLSVKWALNNLGATSLTGCGDYYAWAATTVNTQYNWANAPYYAGSLTTWSKYTDKGATLEAADDAATVNWGSKWRMPTQAEWQELFDNCTLTWVENYNGSGVEGVLATSKKEGYTDQSIFLPVSGYINDQENKGKVNATYVCYWSSTLSSGSNYQGYGVSTNLRHITGLGSETSSVNTSDQITVDWRCVGMPIRPVQP